MIDDREAWNPNLHCKCFFYKKKKLGLPTVPIYRVTSHTITPTAPGCQQARPFRLRPAHFPPSTRPLATLRRMPKCWNPRSQSNKRDAWKDARFLLFVFRLRLFCKPWTGAFWSSSQMTRLLMGVEQCHIWFHAYSWREPHSWDHALWRGKIKRALPPTWGMKNVIVETRRVIEKV